MQKHRPKRPNPDDPIPLIEDLVKVMTDAGLEALEPHAGAMRGQEMNATFVIACGLAAWRVHRAYMKKIGQTKTKARLTFLKTMKHVAKDDVL